MNNSKSTVITSRLPNEDFDRLESRVDWTGVDRTELIRQYVLTGLGELGAMSLHNWLLEEWIKSKALRETERMKILYDMLHYEGQYRKWSIVTIPQLKHFEAIGMINRTEKNFLIFDRMIKNPDSVRSDHRRLSYEEYWGLIKDRNQYSKLIGEKRKRELLRSVHKFVVNSNWTRSNTD